MYRTPRARAVQRADELEVMAQRDGMRRTIASSLAEHLPRYGVPPGQRSKNVLRLFLWETSGEREQLLRALTACYRARDNFVDEEKHRTY